MTKRMQTILVFSLLMLTGSLRAQTDAARAPAAQNATGSTQAAPAAPKAATGDPNYVIGGQDVLDVSVWKEPEVSRSAPVRPDGKISLPLLGDVQAAGLTPSQLAAQIKTGLIKFMNNPEVTVMVTQINSQRIYILGEVNRAGAYALLPGMTVLQALSNAGGFTAFANSKKIYLLRQDNGTQQKLFFNYKDVIAGKSTQQNITLKAGDTIVVP